MSRDRRDCRERVAKCLARSGVSVGFGATLKGCITVSSTESITRSQDLSDRAKEISARELARYGERTLKSQGATNRARQVLPLGVPSSFQAYDPHPLVIESAAGAVMRDVDGNEYVDFLEPPRVL